MDAFRDRRAAGEALGRAVAARVDATEQPLVLALPRGGVPVAYEVATALDAPLEIFVVRKLGVPGHEELAMGAIATGDTVVLNDRLVNGLGITPDAIDEVVQRERAELARRQRAYRGDRPLPALDGRTVVLVDDGLATGSTMRAAILAVRSHEPARTVVAVPVAAAQTVAELAPDVDDVIVLVTPSPFYAVGQAYQDFTQMSDDDVHHVLDS